MCRGCYERTALAAYNFDGNELTQLWLHDSKSPGQGAYGQGNHNLSVGDVDEDGCDEIVYGACVIDQDGSLLYRTGWGHGDAMHLSDIDPDIPGLEVFCVHEETTAEYGFELHRAGTGEYLTGEFTGSDVGRGVAADIDPNYRGQEFWTTEGGVRDCKGNSIGGSRPSMNFRVYWDGDLQDELFDRSVITKWNPSKKKAETLINLYNYGNATDCAVVKYTPNIQADLLGDWREEVVLWDKSDSSSLVLFTTTTPTAYRIPTLMHDHVYRMGIAWQNVAYNQPPHLGYYIGDGDIEYARLTKISSGDRNQTVGIFMPIDTITFRWDRCDGVELNRALPAGISSEYDEASRTISFFGTPTTAGNYSIELCTYGNPVSNPVETISFDIIGEDKITTVAQYHFDETSGSSAANAIFGQAVAEGFSPEWVTGHSGNALSFPASIAETGCLKQTAYPELETLADNSFTIALWVKGEKADQCILNIEGDNGSYIRIEGDNLLRFSVSDGTNETQLTARIMPSLFNNEWNQLLCIRDREDGKLYMFLNGERRAQTDDKCGNLEISSLTIGNREEEGTYLPFKSLIDELVVSTGAMNERQAAEYYEKTSAGIVEPGVADGSLLQVFPTYFTDQLQIQFNRETSGTAIVSLHNNAGAVVFEREYNVDRLPRLIIAGFDGLPQGYYTLTITTSEGTLSRKLIKR